MTIVNNDTALSFFLLLLLGHVVGDFLLQPYWLVLAKRRGWTGLILHVGVVVFTTAILVWNSIPNWWVWIIILYVGHLFIDQFRTFVFTNNTKGRGLLLLILDQLAHVVLIWLIAWAATGFTWSNLAMLVSFNTPNQFRLIAYLIGLATLISTAPVLEAEVTVAVWAAQGQEIDHTLRIDTSDRVLGSLERISAMGFILTGFGLLAPLVFLPRLGLMIYRGQARENRTQVTTKVLTSLATAIVVSLLLINVPAPTVFL